MKRRIIEFQYFDGCPNSSATFDNLNKLVREGFIDENIIKISNIPNAEAAERFNFQGSPTILVDGVDIYTEKKPASFNYTCRIYEFDGFRTGIIPKEFIKEKINKLFR